MPSKCPARTLNEIITIGEVLDEAKYDALAAALDDARNSILSRLRNPDEAMVRRFADSRAKYPDTFTGLCRALADVLATPPEATEE